MLNALEPPTTASIVHRLFEDGKLFIFGFCDSQHLFSAFNLLVLVLVAGFPYKEHNKIVVLLKYMADHRNLSAKRYIERISSINAFLEDIPEVNMRFDLHADVRSYMNSTNADWS